jgi:hypothetical protein
MFSWKNRSRLAPPPRRARLALERLEGRDCPSVGVQPNNMLWYILNTSAPPPATRPVGMTPGENFGPGGGGGPVITLNLTYNGRTSVTLSGTVTDNLCSPSGLTVDLGGEVSVSTVTNSSGYFSVTTNAAGLGTISASTVDALGIASNTATVTVTSSAPTISNFTAAEAAGYLFTFTGTVTDASPAGLTVSFGGIPSLTNQTTTVASNGTFTFSIQLNPNGSDNGIATAQTTNWWGLQSNLAMDSVFVTP